VAAVTVPLASCLARLGEWQLNQLSVSGGPILRRRGGDGIQIVFHLCSYREGRAVGSSDEWCVCVSSFLLCGRWRPRGQAERRAGAEERRGGEGQGAGAGGAGVGTAGSGERQSFVLPLSSSSLLWVVGVCERGGKGVARRSSPPPSSRHSLTLTPTHTHTW
jgi:hypothetical protein